MLDCSGACDHNVAAYQLECSACAWPSVNHYTNNQRSWGVAATAALQSRACTVRGAPCGEGLFCKTTHSQGCQTDALPCASHHIYTHAHSYTLQSTNATIEYKSTGSSSGLRALDEGTIDWAATDLFVSKANVTLLPTVAAPITVVYNLPEAQFAQGHHTDRIFLDAAAITGIFDGTIARWNHPALQALNPSLSHALPDKDIQVVVRADASGTTSIFTTAMSRLNTTWAANIGNGSRVDWPVPASRLHAANRTAGTAATLVTTPYSIGYLVLSEALEHGLLYAGFVSSAGHKLLPTQAAMTAAVIEFRSSR